MRVLFYYDPVSHRGDCLWRRAHPGADGQMYRGLVHRNVRQDTNVKLFMNGWYAGSMLDHGIAERDLVTVDEEEFLRFFPDPHADLNRIWYERSNSSAQIEGVAELVKAKLAGFEPDVIITWTPVPFLRLLFPHA